MYVKGVITLFALCHQRYKERSQPAAIFTDFKIFDESQNDSFLKRKLL